ncbi:MAG: tRNA G18 (ribose-2'-O)-methylase SpoU [Actinomycetes bacterium]|jgi:tRNA G18 (ribose-2'-O)-methylase SpoU
MREVVITNPGDPRLDPYMRLTDIQLRLRKEPAEGIFLAEGQRVIERALDSGFELVSALMEQKWLPRLADALSRHDCDVYLGDEHLLKSVTGFRLHRGALAVFRRQPLPSVTDVISAAQRVVVLEGLVDHTNVGLIFRSVAALGADAVLVSPQCADPLYRRSVKVSMGAVFTVPWTRAEPWPWVLDDLGEHGFTRLALTPAPDALSLRDWPRDDVSKIALILGSEGPGLSVDVLSRVDTALRIPMTDRVDSLNVAATAAVACFVLAAGNEVP